MAAQIKITVQDAGIGFTEEEEKRLFEAFEPLESNLYVQEGGAGLGLYLTKKVFTEFLGGGIFLENLPGNDSTSGIRTPKMLPVDEKSTME